MDVIVKLTVPNYIYRFYRNASQHINGASPEAVMSDALSAYAGLLSEDVAKKRTEECADAHQENGMEPLGNSSPSRSR